MQISPQKVATLQNLATGSTGSPGKAKVQIATNPQPVTPNGTLGNPYDVSLSSRLESLESGLKKLTDCVSKATIGNIQQQPVVTLTPPSPPAQLQPGQIGQGMGQQVNGEAQTSATTFATIAGSGGGGAGRAVGGTGSAGAGGSGVAGSGATGYGSGRQRGRLRSQGQGQKRDRDGTPVQEGEQPFQPVNNRRRRPVNHGSSRVEVDEAGVAAPIEIYVGNTTPAATEEVVKNVLIKCAKAFNPDTDFSVVEVVRLATHIENPRTKCWKVVIPHKFKDIIEKDELYPSGWCHRKFFAPRSSQPAKHARKDDTVVQEAIKEQQRQEEAKRQQMEDKLRQEAEVAKASAPPMED